MSTLRETLARLAAFFHKDRLDREFDEELTAHIALATEDHLRRGLDAPEARRRALLELGGLDASKARHREARGLPSIDGLLQDVRYAFRGLRRSPGFTLTAVATLAVGIGLNTAVFTVTNAVLCKAFPFIAQSDRILYIDGPGINGQVSYPDFQDWQARATTFTGMAAVAAAWTTLNDDNGAAESLGTTLITANGLKLIGQQPILGRDFAPSDEAPGAAQVALISHRLWERRYGKNSAIIGRTIRISSGLDLPVFRNDVPTTVIGIMPPGFSFPLEQDIWMPLVPTAALRQRGVHSITFLFGRIAGGVTVPAARAEITAIGAQLAAAYPATDQGFTHPEVQTFNEHFIGPKAAMMFESMLGAVGFVLLIACANLANLTLARAVGQAREISLRIALGAGRWRIVRQVLIESVMLSVLGGAGGWFLAGLGVQAYALADFAPFPYAHHVDLTMDYQVLGYLTAISIATGVLFGLAPVSRLLALDLNATLKDGARGAIGSERGRRVSALLVIGELALAVVLLAGAAAMIRSFVTIQTADVGVDTAKVLTASLNLPAAGYPDASAQVAFADRLTARLGSVPGVESVAIANRRPAYGSMRLSYELPGDPALDEQLRPQVSALVIGPRYVLTMRAAVLSGREFTSADDVSGAPVVLVNQLFASQHWPGKSPLGKPVRLFNGSAPAPWRTVVGVVSNIVQDDTAQQAVESLAYVPYAQMPARYLHVLVRTRVAPGGVEAALQREVQSMDPGLPASFAALTERMAQNYRDHGLLSALFAIFAAVALLLASVGLHAVIAHAVGQRTQEIGVRMAMGASARAILTLVLGQGMLPVGAGLALGLAAACAITPLLGSMLVQVSPTDPGTFAIAAVVLAGAAALGCWIPARRAMRVDPVVALRHE